MLWAMNIAHLSARPAARRAPLGALVVLGAACATTGAEGLFARSTGILVSSLGTQAVLTDEDVDRVRTLRRDELPGRPLLWQAAIRNLVAELTGRGEIAAR
jgi:hypothetical protein